MCSRNGCNTRLWRALPSSGRAGFGHGLGGVLLELAGVGIEPADAFAELLDGHLILVVLEAVGLLVEVDERGVGRGCGALGGELGLEFAVLARKLGDQLGADGEQIAARQIDDLIDFAEARAHDLRLVAVLLVVVVDADHAATPGSSSRAISDTPFDFLYQS